MVRKMVSGPNGTKTVRKNMRKTTKTVTKMASGLSGIRMVRKRKRKITKVAKKKLDIGILEIQKGGRGNTTKKPIGFRVVRNTNKRNYSATVE